MHLRSVDDGRGPGERPSASTFRPAHEGRGTRHERVREIRRRLADDAYLSEAVAEEIARRILMSREL